MNTSPDPADEADDFDPHELEPADFRDEVYSFEFWFQAVDGYLRDRPYGHHEGVAPLSLDPSRREALITTLCNYCVGETAALEGASGMIEFAPNRHAKIFLATQVVDEARHLEVFLHRLSELGVEDPEAEIVARANPSLVRFKERLLEFVAGKDWDAAVFAQNVVLETMENTAFRAHESTADPVTAEILDGVIKDERRHLGFGENDLGATLMRNPGVKSRLTAIRSELDPLVLGTFEAAMGDLGADSERREALGREYLTAIERLGLA